METQDKNPIDDALRMVDEALARTIGRELLSSAEVVDELLDVRAVLTAV